MDNKTGYKPRVNVAITPQQKRLLDKYIPWGAKSKIFSNIIDVFLEACKVDEKKAIAGFFTGQLEIVVREEDSGRSAKSTKKHSNSPSK